MPEIDDLSYTYPIEELAAGASYGNQRLFIRTDARSNLLSAWSSSDHQWYCGALRFRFTTRNEVLAPMVTRFFPAYQETIYGTEGVILSHRVFVPHAAGYERAVCWLLEVQAEGPHLIEIAIDIQFVPAIEPELLPEVSLGQREKQIALRMDRGIVVAETMPTYYSRFDRTEGRAKEIRVFGTSGPPTVYLFTEPGRARLLYHVLVEGYYDLPFVLGFSPSGQQVVWQGFLVLSEITTAFEDTLKYVDRMLTRATIFTPDPVINRGVQWAKVGMLRCRQQFRRGPAIPHDPPGDRVFIRDVVWYSLASSYLLPQETGEMLRYVAAETMNEAGKLADHFRADTGEAEDYGLNINDATPLFLLAVQHHFQVTRDEDFLEAIYPAVQRAADYIILQIEDGLVACTAQGTNVYGIAGWRNRIPGYTLNGAVTEINALCAGALCAAAELARHLDQSDHLARWSAMGEELKGALNERLVSQETGVYLLARDLAGREHQMLSGDLVFPVLTGVALPLLEDRVLDLLHGGVFWSPAGVHSVGVNQPAYDPAYAGGLLGGIWPALTAWVAYAGRQRYPEHVAAALHNIFTLTEADSPIEHLHLVPGQIPEWLHGDTLESLGRDLSCRSAASYLQLALEGLAGISYQGQELWIDPILPDDWAWLAVDHVRIGELDLSFFYYDGILHSNQPVKSSSPVEVYDAIERVPQVPGYMFLLKKGRGRQLFAASVDEEIDMQFTADGRRWKVQLAVGEATLLP